MRSALTEIPGVSNIELSTADRSGSFELSGDYDIDAKLTELGETNEHIAGWSHTNG